MFKKVNYLMLELIFAIVLTLFAIYLSDFFSDASAGMENILFHFMSAR